MPGSKKEKKSPKIDLANLEVKGVQSASAQVKPAVPDSRVDQAAKIFRHIINFVLGLLEFLTLVMIMSTILIYGWRIVVEKNAVSYKEALKAIQTIDKHWKAALIIIGLILSRIVLKKIYELRVIAKDKAEFEKDR